VKLDRSHPADDRLIALYFGDEAASADNRRIVRQHLHGCEACTWRYTELTAPLERLRQDAASEADEVFTSARLSQQRAAVLARLEGAAVEQKVLPFPSATARTNRSLVRRPLFRWVAAAAAAGLLVGVMAGRLFDFGVSNITAPAPVARAARPVLPPIADTVSDSPSAEVFEGDELALIELDQAVHTQRIAALSALDQITPTMRPESMIARARSIR
jgi:hypothetical protein